MRRRGCGERTDGHERPALSGGGSVCRRGPSLCDHHRVSTFGGTVGVPRPGSGAAGTSSLHPLDGALNLPPEKYSLEVRRRAAIEAAKSSFDEGVKTLE